MPDLTSVELETLISAVDEFVATAEFYREARDHSAWHRRELRELQADVAKAAGQAHGAAKIAGYQVHGPDGTSFTWDPIMNWNKSLDPLKDPLDDAIEAGHQIQGILEAKVRKARQDERSLVGRVARVVGFSGRVRKYLADRGLSTSVQNVGFFLAVTAQVLGGLIVAWLVYLVLG